MEFVSAVFVQASGRKYVHCEPLGRPIQSSCHYLENCRTPSIHQSFDFNKIYEKQNGEYPDGRE